MRLRYHQPTKDYLTRRLAQGKPKNESSAVSSATSPGKSSQRSNPYATSSSPTHLTFHTSLAQVEGFWPDGSWHAQPPAAPAPPTNSAPEPAIGRQS